MPGWFAEWIPGGVDAIAILNAAAVAVILIAAIGAVGAFTEKYLSSAVAKRVGHDLRLVLYHHVQRMSLSFYELRQTGDMVVRLTPATSMPPRISSRLPRSASSSMA
jgi:subfamily B ATP-binding cassette protein MsbA